MADEEIEWHDVNETDPPRVNEAVWLFCQIGTCGSGVMGAVSLAMLTPDRSWVSVGSGPPVTFHAPLAWAKITPPSDPVLVPARWSTA